MTTFTTEDRKFAEQHSEIIKNECPCDKCEHFEKCKFNEWACRSFAKFVIDNYYYKDAIKDPCQGTFNKIFNQKDENVLRNFVRQFKEEDFENKVKSNEGK